MKRIILYFLCLVSFLSLLLGNSFSIKKNNDQNSTLGSETEECLDCHISVTPGIVEDWASGVHSRTTPAESLEKSNLEKKVSNPEVPEGLKNKIVGCYECHSLNTDKHTDSFDHFNYKINVIVSPSDCAVCHSEEKDQYSSSKKAHALDNLRKNPIYSTLVDTITGFMPSEQEDIRQPDGTENAKNESCYACHGTEVKVTGMVTLETDIADLELPVLSNWPNQGVGRINPDGSVGACSACHPRHSFSIEIARKPDTCSQCHLEPDVPAWNVFRESKHGNIFHSKQTQWNWNHVPWTVGADFKSPTCAVCHNSLLIDQEGTVLAERSHDFGARLWIRIFGLVFSHPQPKDGRTYLIKNPDGLPLPTTFSGKLADGYLIEKNEQDLRRTKMEHICTSCHSSLWTSGYFNKFNETIAEADKMVLAATNLLTEAWEKGMVNNKNPFDEHLEHLWIEQWLFNANCLRYASAMSGPDFAGFKYGWWKLNKTLQELQFYMDHYQ